MRAEPFSEFIKRKKRTGKNNHPFDIRNSWGVYDYYKYYRHEAVVKKKPHLKDKQYYQLIRLVNSMFMDQLIKEKRIELPHNMGVLEAVGFNHSVKIVDGKLKTTRAVDWDKTLKLWYEDEEAEKNKTLVRKENTFGIIVKYRKNTAIYNNKAFYDFKMHREKQELLRKSLLYGNESEIPYFIDTFGVKQFYNG